MAAAADVGAAVEEVAASRPMGWLARIGLAARAAVYLLMGWLGVIVALGGNATVDQRGAVRSLLEQPLGTLLVWLLIVGFLAYAIWRFSEVAFGVDGGDDGPVPRGKSLIRGLAYCVFAFGAVAVVNGARQSQERQQEDLADSTLSVPGGQVILALIGAAFVVAGLLMVWEGLTVKFLHYFDYLPPARRIAVVWLGRIGSVARGAVFALAGALALIGAVVSDPSKAGGFNEVVDQALGLPLGSALVALMGLGLIIFGVYGLAEALWRHVPDGQATP